jgi:hypothetical protein
MFCPFFVWLAPLLLFTLFHYTAFAMRVFYQPSVEAGAQSSDGDTTYLIFIFLNLVFIGAINTSYGYFMLQPVLHTCGAFFSLTATGGTIIDVLYTRSSLVSV